MTTLALAASCVFSSVGSSVASADSTTPPPWDTFSPTDGATYNNYTSPVGYGAVGGVLFFNAAGQQITGGSTTTAPIAAYAEGTASTGGKKVQLAIALPASSDPSGWSEFSESSVATAFPITSGAPSNLENVSSGPVYKGSSNDQTLSSFLNEFTDSGNPDTGYYQVRLYTSGTGSIGTEFNAADIYVDTSNNTWTLAYSYNAFAGPSSVPAPVGTAVSLTTTAGTSGPAGTSVPLTATVTANDGSSPDGGTVQFYVGGTATGLPVTVSGGKAQMTYNTTATDEPSDSFTAKFTPVSGTNYSTSTSSPLDFGVEIPTTTTLAASPSSPQPAGTAVSFTATVSDSDASTPSGTVTFKDGSTVLASNQALSLVSGHYVATFSSSSLTAATHSISAVYNPPTNYAVSSDTISYTVTNTTTVLTASPAGSGVVSTPVTLTATITDSDGTAPTGTVTFKDGSSVLASAQPVTLVSGQYVATYTTSSLSLGGHSLSAIYNPPAGYPSSTGTLSYSIAAIATTTTLTGSPTSPDTYGTSVTFTATVSDSDSSAPTGTVTFEDGSTPLASNVALSLVSGQYVATYTTGALSVGTHSLSALYTPPASAAASTGTLSYTVNTIPTTTTLVGSPTSPAIYGASATFTATVSDSNGSAPTGTVTFEDGSTPLASNVAVSLVSGQYVATYTTSGLSVGTHSLSAIYNPPATAAGSTGTLSYTVNTIPTTTTLAGSPASPDTYGSPATFTATVSDSDSSVPTGSVTFKDGSTPLASNVVLVLVSGHYIATYSTSSLSVGGHSLSAVYNPPANVSPSTGSLTYSVAAIGTTSDLSVSPSGENPIGTSVTITAAITDADHSAPTGTVTFKDGGTVLQSNVAITNDVGTYEAQVTTSALSAGSHALSAVYNAPANYAGSTADLTYEVGTVSGRSGKGYWLFSSDGGVFTYGNAAFYGSAGALDLNAPVVTGVPTPDDAGYWLFASDGGVFSYGDAVFYGSTGNLVLNAPIVAAAVTPDGRGYWLFAKDGGVFTFGDAAFYGSAGNLSLNAPIMAAASTPDGAGYWLFASDGGVLTYGDAAFYGSAASTHLRSPVMAAVATPDGSGYWLVTWDGGVSAYGDAVWYGAAGDLHLGAPIRAVVSTPDGGGYWLVGSDGGVLSYGDAAFLGSAGSIHLDAPVVAAAGA